MKPEIPNPLAARISCWLRNVCSTNCAGVLLITLGELGMFALSARAKAVSHSDRRAGGVDVSGAGDTVIAAFNTGHRGGASPVEAAMLSNHAAGIVVGKIGTAVGDAGEC